MSASPLIVGIDLGGTNMQIGAVNAKGKIVGRAKRKTKAELGPDAVLERIVEGVNAACDDAELGVGDVEAIGIGAPGAIDFERGVVLEAPNLGWTDFPLVERLSASLKGKPVVLENHVNVAIYGENQLGAGANARDVLGVWIGTGIGGGLILDGKLYHGALGTAGEVGHMILFPKAALGHRTLEQNCSRKHVVDRMRKLVEAGRKTKLRDLADGSSRIGSKLVAQAYHDHDELTVSVINEVAEFIGASLASVVTLLSLPRVVLGGGLTEALGQPFVDRVKEAVDQYVFPSKLREVEVLPTKLEDDAGLLGAAILARESVEQTAA